MRADVIQKAFDALDKSAQEAVLKAGAAAEARGWQISEQKDQEYVKELSAKGMKVGNPPEALRGGLAAIGGSMTAEWLKTAGDNGKAILDAFKK